MADKAPKPTPMINRSIYLPETLATEVEELAATQGHKFNSYVRHMLEQQVALAKAQAMLRTPAKAV